MVISFQIHSEKKRALKGACTSIQQTQASFLCVRARFYDKLEGLSQVDLWNTKTIKRIFGRWEMLGKSARGTDFPLVKMASVVHYTQWESSRLALWSTRVIGSYVVKKKTEWATVVEDCTKKHKKKCELTCLCLFCWSYFRSNQTFGLQSMKGCDEISCWKHLFIPPTWCIMTMSKW